jgi:CHAD domain-containing protein
MAPPAMVVGRVRRQTRKRGKGFAGQSEEQRHQPRIAMKKTRYACELLAVLSSPADKTIHSAAEAPPG